VASYANTCQIRHITKPRALLSLVSSITEVERSSFSKASQHSKWIDAMTEECRALLANNTWDLVPPPSGQNIVGCKWVYKIKYHSEGGIERCKARLVA